MKAADILCYPHPLGGPVQIRIVKAQGGFNRTLTRSVLFCHGNRQGKETETAPSTNRTAGEAQAASLIFARNPLTTRCTTTMWVFSAISMSSTGLCTQRSTVLLSFPPLKPLKPTVKSPLSAAH